MHAITAIARGVLIGFGSMFFVAALDLGFPFRRGVIQQDQVHSTMAFGAALLVPLLVLFVLNGGTNDAKEPAKETSAVKRPIGWVLLSNKSFSGKGVAIDEEQARRRMQRLVNRSLRARLTADQVSQLQAELLDNAPQYFAACDRIVYDGTRNGTLRSALAKCVDAERLEECRLDDE